MYIYIFVNKNNVRINACNVVDGEMERYPLYVACYISNVKYWIDLVHIDNINSRQ